MKKSYFLGDEEIKAINDVTLEVDKGEYLAIVGPSGSGKSTLMNIIGLLDVADSGKYILDGLDISHTHEDRLAKIRNEKIGFIFKSFNLLGKLDALEKVSDRVKYTINFTLSKIDEEWLVDDLTETERMKIHGLYAY